MPKKNTNKKVSGAQKVGIGVGLTTAAVAAAGAYFLYGSPKASKNRKKVKSWALKAKAEILEALEDAKDITEDEFNALVGTVAGVYATTKSASKKEVADFKREMMQHWKQIEKTAPARKVTRAAKRAVKRAIKRKPARKAKKRSAKKAVKKTAKKVAKKTAKKGGRKTARRR